LVAPLAAVDAVRARIAPARGARAASARIAGDAAAGAAATAAVARAVAASKDDAAGRPASRPTVLSGGASAGAAAVIGASAGAAARTVAAVRGVASVAAPVAVAALARRDQGQAWDYSVGRDRQSSRATCISASSVSGRAGARNNGGNVLGVEESSSTVFRRGGVCLAPQLGQGRPSRRKVATSRQTVARLTPSRRASFVC